MWQLLTSMNSWLVSGLSRTEKYDCSDVFWALICPLASCNEGVFPSERVFFLDELWNSTFQLITWDTRFGAHIYVMYRLYRDVCCVCKAVLQTIYFSTQTGIRTLAIILAFKVCFAFRPPAQVKNLGVFLPKKVSPHSKFQTASSDIKPCLCWNAPEVTRTGAFQDMARCNSRHVWCRFECRKKMVGVFSCCKISHQKKTCSSRNWPYFGFLFRVHPG